MAKRDGKRDLNNNDDEGPNTLYIACRIRYLKRLMMQITGLIQYYGFCGTNEY
jgi:hypothetical protein